MVGLPGTRRGNRGHDDAMLALLGVAQAECLQFAEEHSPEFELAGRAGISRRTLDRLGVDADVAAKAIEEGRGWNGHDSSFDCKDLKDEFSDFKDEG